MITRLTKQKLTNKLTCGLTNNQQTTNKQLTTNKNDKNNKNNKNIKKENIIKEKKTFEDIFFENNFSSDLENTLRDFIDMRKAIKKPMTTKALELLLKNLDRLTNLEAEKIEILNQSIEHGWQSVYPLKNKCVENQESWEEWAKKHE